jgi:tetratricopeptide (TPR) repeat protein
MTRLRIVTICLACLLITGLTGCCQRTRTPGKKPVPVDAGNEFTGTQKRPGKDSVAEQPLDILAKTGLNYSIDSRGKTAGAQKQNANAFFEKQYLEGIELMEKGEFTKAISLFETISQRYPNSEEASVAELCIAELYFRNKSNHLALKVYKEIVEKYPNSHAAENARAGIAYLQDFEKYEKEYVPADVDDRRRRGY